jgi:predicted nucleotidyltransferase
VQAARAFAAQAAARDERVVKVGLFGSYARGTEGVGSDLDLVVVVRETDEPFERRALAYDATALPVPAEVLVYTVEEWERMAAEGGFPQTLARDVVWLFERR